MTALNHFPLSPPLPALAASFTCFSLNESPTDLTLHSFLKVSNQKGVPKETAAAITIPGRADRKPRTHASIADMLTGISPQPNGIQSLLS